MHNRYYFSRFLGARSVREVPYTREGGRRRVSRSSPASRVPASLTCCACEGKVLVSVDSFLFQLRDLKFVKTTTRTRFSQYCSARAWTSVILAGKCDSHRHSTTSFSKNVCGTNKSSNVNGWLFFKFLQLKIIVLAFLVKESTMKLSGVPFVTRKTSRQISSS